MPFTVHKFQLNRGTTTFILGGRSFNPISVGMQDDTICVWAEVNTDDKFKSQYAFDIYGTGWAIPDTATHLGSVFEGPYVWHIYFKRV